MLDKKIIHLKNTLFIKTSISIVMFIAGFWLSDSLSNEYIEVKSKLNDIHPIIIETRLKLEEIKDSNYNITEGITKYNDILGKTDEARCKEYQDVIVKIEDLGNKYSLADPIKAILNPKHQKLHISHSKTSYISAHEMKIEFSARDMSEAFDIYTDIATILPQYTIIYLIEMKESAALNPKILHSITPNSKPSVIKCKLYVKMRDVVMIKTHPSSSGERSSSRGSPAI